MMKIQRRRYLTLIEIMIVIFLIMIVTGALAYNLKGSMDQGKVFATQTGMARLADQLELAVAKNPELLDEIESRWQAVIDESPMVQNASQMKKDGWGQTYDVRVVDDHIEVRSRKFEEYKKSHPTLFKD